MIADVVDARPMAMFQLAVPEPEPPTPDAHLTYCVYSPHFTGVERDDLSHALDDYAKAGSRCGQLVALAATYGDDGIECLWRSEWDSVGRVWGEWR
jgi:hypothetical protein